jgi:hypothetical protein
MGSYSITCGISNLSIREGDKIVFFPLLKRKYSLIDGLENCSNLISNSGSYALFKLFSLPLFGQYNDYGDIENYEKDANYYILEKILKEYSSYENVEQFITNINIGDGKFNDLNVAGMFVLRNVYEHLVNSKLGDENGTIRDAYHKLDLTPNILKILGFKQIENNTDSRFKYTYVLENCDLFQIHGDGTWIHIIKDNNKISIFSIYELNQFLLKEGIDLIEKNKYLYVNVSPFYFKYEGLKKCANILQEVKIKFNIEKIKDINKLITDKNYKLINDNFNYIKLLFESIDIINNNYLENFHINDIGIINFFDMYIDSILNDSIKKILCDYHDFYWSMLNLNKGFIPQFISTQFGCFEANKNLADFVSEYCKEQIHKY